MEQHLAGTTAFRGAAFDQPMPAGKTDELEPDRAPGDQENALLQIARRGGDNPLTEGLNEGVIQLVIEGVIRLWMIRVKADRVFRLQTDQTIQHGMTTLRIED